MQHQVTRMALIAAPRTKWETVKAKVSFLSRYSKLEKSGTCAETLNLYNQCSYYSTFFNLLASGLDRKEESTTDVDFSYKDVSQLSEVTDDVYAESVADEDADLRDYNRLIQQTQKKLHIVGKWSASHATIDIL